MGRNMTVESGFQDSIVKRLKSEFPGCMVTKQTYPQGIPDLLILYGNKYAMLETKRASGAHKQPNQDYYVELFNRQSFASFINPQNAEEVFYGLHEFFKTT